MNVYVESGFVVTLALEQDDYQNASAILELARRRRITLKVPTFGLSEPSSTVVYRANSRNRLMNELSNEIRELGRTRPYERLARDLNQYRVELRDILQTQLEALEAVVLNLSQDCEILPLDATMLARAVSYRVAHSLRPQDAIILAAVILDLERTQHPDGALFISQNDKDFEKPSIQAQLQQLNCKYLVDFTNALRYIERPDSGTT